MMTAARLAFAILVFSAASWCSAVSAQTPPQPPATAADGRKVPSGDVNNGKRIYTAYGCYACHGYEGQGGVHGPRVAPNPVPFEAFVGLLRKPPNQMPPYAATVLSNQELSDIYAFLLTIRNPPDLKSIRLLN